MVPWIPGTVEAVGYKGGKEVVRTSQITAGVPAKLELSAEGESCPIVTVAAIDDKISIDLRKGAIRGKLKDYEFKVLYSTDGSKPLKEYAGAFTVKPDTTVKADVFNGSELLFSMSEKFGPEEGIYWGSTENVAPAAASGGDQAEDVKFEGAYVFTKGENFHGKGFLDFGKKRDAYVE